MSDARLQKQRGGRLPHLSLDLLRVVLLLGTVDRQGVQLLEAVRDGGAGDGRLEQPLRDHVGIPAIGSGGVRVVVDGKTEMPRGLSPRRLDLILARSKQLHHGNREVRKALRVRLSAPAQEHLKSGGVGLSREILVQLGRELDDLLPSLR